MTDKNNFAPTKRPSIRGEKDSTIDADDNKIDDVIGVLQTFCDSMIVIRGSGGVCVTELDVEDAVKVFLVWLKRERIRQTKLREVRQRRAGMGLVPNSEGEP